VLKVDVFTTNDIEMAKGSVLVVKWFFLSGWSVVNKKNVLIGLLFFSLLCCLHYLFIYLYLLPLDWFVIYLVCALVDGILFAVGFFGKCFLLVSFSLCLSLCIYAWNNVVLYVRCLLIIILPLCCPV